jgi:hypothetical protein
MPRVIKKFKDKHTGTLYNVGASFNGEKQRVAELTQKGILEPSQNVHAEPVHLGAGWYELADGTRVRGKENAYKG